MSRAQAAEHPQLGTLQPAQRLALVSTPAPQGRGQDKGQAGVQLRVGWLREGAPPAP